MRYNEYTHSICYDGVTICEIAVEKGKVEINLGQLVCNSCIGLSPRDRYVVGNDGKTMIDTTVTFYV